MTRFQRFAATALFALLAACTAPTPQGDASAAPPAATSPADAPAPTPAPSTPVAEAQTPKLPAKPPRMSTPLPLQKVKGAPVAVDTSCRSDADCVVKDVGNCCGYFPACVNKDSPTNPAAVRAQCAKDGMASVCGFREISACSCNAGKCEASGSGGPVAQ